MPRPRLSIAGMLGVVFVAAIGFAAVRSGSPAWSGLVLSITIFAMVASLLGVALRRRERRVFWAGFALLGWTYLGLTCTTWNGTIGRHLVGPTLFVAVYDAIHAVEGGPSGVNALNGMPAFQGGMGGGFRAMPLAGGGAVQVPTVWTANPDDVVRIGMCLEALAWAYLGGWAARYFAVGRRPDPAVPSA